MSVLQRFFCCSPRTIILVFLDIKASLSLEPETNLDQCSNFGGYLEILLKEFFCDSNFVWIQNFNHDHFDNLNFESFQKNGKKYQNPNSEKLSLCQFSKFWIHENWIHAKFEQKENSQTQIERVGNTKFGCYPKKGSTCSSAFIF